MHNIPYLTSHSYNYERWLWTLIHFNVNLWCDLLLYKAVKGSVWWNMSTYFNEIELQDYIVHLMTAIHFILYSTDLYQPIFMVKNLRYKPDCYYLFVRDEFHNIFFYCEWVFSYWRCIFSVNNLLKLHVKFMAVTT